MSVAMGRRVWALIVAASFGWGTSGVATRAALIEGIDPFVLILARFVLGTLLLVGFLALRNGMPTGLAEWRAGLVLGTVNMAAPTILITLALRHISAGLGGVLIALVPIATALWAHFLLADEPLTLATLGGLLVAMGGVAALLLVGETGIAGGNLPAGVGLAMLGVTAAALGGVFSRRYAQRLAITSLAGPQFVLATVTAAVASLWLAAPGAWTVSTTGWALIVYLAVVGTVLPFVTFLAAIREAPATKVALIGYIIPVIGLIGGVLLLDEQVTAAMLGGIVLIFAGIVLVDRAGPVPGP